MKNSINLVYFLGLFCLCGSAVKAQTPGVLTLHLVGDSTMADKPNMAYPERGWGQLLPQFIAPTLTVSNHAANGRSTRRFIDEGRWGKVLSEVKQGDYVLIQFGHNDGKKSDPQRYASVEQDYPAFLRRYIADVHKIGATPLIASSICRRHFKPDGSLDRNLLDYAQAAQQVAQQTNTAFFDLQLLTCDFLASIGDEQSQQYFIQVPPDLYSRYPDGKVDNTHLNVVGASKVAQFFVRDLIAQKHPLAEFVYRQSL